jgi:phenylpyruvate tautomerase PptA (4-oxalocrotonate tautomerase family)
MPSALIEIRRQYSQEEEIALIEAVHSAMREGLKIPEWDRNVRLLVHEPHRFAVPPNRDQPEFYTHISIDLFIGRSLDAKRRLYQAIVRNLEPFGIPADHVKILLREIPRDNWGIRGGIPASEVDLGFEVNI